MLAGVRATVDGLAMSRAGGVFASARRTGAASAEELSTER